MNIINLDDCSVDYFETVETFLIKYFIRLSTKIVMLKKKHIQYPPFTAYLGENSFASSRFADVLASCLCSDIYMLDQFLCFTTFLYYTYTQYRVYFETLLKLLLNLFKTCLPIKLYIRKNVRPGKLRITVLYESLYTKKFSLLF